MYITLHARATPIPFLLQKVMECDHFFLQLGTTAIGVKSKEGVVLVVEKRVTSPLLVCSHS